MISTMKGLSLKMLSWVRCWVQCARRGRHGSRTHSVAPSLLPGTAQAFVLVKYA